MWLLVLEGAPASLTWYGGFFLATVPYSKQHTHTHQQGGCGPAHTLLLHGGPVAALLLQELHHGLTETHRFQHPLTWWEKFGRHGNCGWSSSAPGLFSGSFYTPPQTCSRQNKITKASKQNRAWRNLEIWKTASSAWPWASQQSWGERSTAKPEKTLKSLIVTVIEKKRTFHIAGGGGNSGKHSRMREIILCKQGEFSKTIHENIQVGPKTP